MENRADFNGLFKLKDDSAVWVTFGLETLLLLKAFCKTSQIVNPSHLAVVRCLITVGTVPLDESCWTEPHIFHNGLRPFP